MFYNILITIKYYTSTIDTIEYCGIFALLLINNVIF